MNWASEWPFIWNALLPLKQTNNIFGHTEPSFLRKGPFTQAPDDQKLIYNLEKRAS
jgi:hypothetical protein